MLKAERQRVALAGFDSDTPERASLLPPGVRKGDGRGCCVLGLTHFSLGIANLL